MKLEFFIANGAKNGDGSKEKPFGTIAQAQKAVRLAGRTAHEITVSLLGGRYFLRDTQAFSAEDSGTQNCPVLWRAYPGEKVVFDGGVLLSGDRVKKLDDKEMADKLIDENAASQMYYADLSGLGISFGTYGNRGFRRPYIPAPNEVFINAQPMTVARYPKEEDGTLSLNDVIDGGSTPRTGDFTLRPITFRYNNPRLERWANAKHACVAGYFSTSFADDNIEISKIDPIKHTITTTLPHLYGAGNEPFCCWYIVNLFEEISRPGEYYVDAERECAYFIPPENVDMTTATVQVSVLNKVMFAFENVEHLTFSGFVLEDSRASGIYIEGGESVTIRDCTLQNLGMLAIQMGKGASPMPEGLHTYHGQRKVGIAPPQPLSREMGCWHEYIYEFAAWDNEAGKNHLIDHCEIMDTGTGGILLSGGNRKQLIPGNNTVNNCLITRANRLEKACKGGINLMGVGNKITHCEICDLSGFGIYFYGNDHYIAYNRIHDVLKEVSDAGAIYSGRDMSQVGNVIEKNFIYHLRNSKKDALGICAIYLDDYAIYNRIYGNFFYDIVSDGSFFFSTIYYTCGGLSSIANNIFIDCIPGLDPNVHGNAYYCMHEDSDVVPKVHTTDENSMRGVDVTSEVYREHYPYLYETYEHNFNPGNCYYNNQTYYHNYSFFVDGAHMDFRFKPDAFMYNEPHEDYLIHDVVMGIDGKMVPMERELEFEKIGRYPVQ